MNITIGTGRSNPFGHGRAPYIVAAFGIALVAAAAILGTTWHTGSKQSASPTATSSVTAGYSQPEAGPRTVFLVVGSEEEAARLDGMLSADSYNLVTPIRTEIFVVDTPEKEQALATTELELLESGYPYELADLRQPASTPPAVSSEQSSPQPELNDRIMQGVISSERAAWAFDDTSPAASTSTGAPVIADESIADYAAREAAQIAATSPAQ